MWCYSKEQFLPNLVLSSCTCICTHKFWKDKRLDPLRTSCGLNWENKTYKLGPFISGGRGYSIYPWVGRCRPAHHTLTLFKTKIADFPTLFKTEFRFLIPCLRHLSCLRQKLIKSIPWLRPKMIKSIPCLRQKTRKTYPGWPHVPIKLV